MDAFDEMIRSEVHRVISRAEPSPDLWHRIQRELYARQPARVSGLAAMGAATAIVVAVLALLPGPRALATEWVRRVFQVGRLSYAVVRNQPMTVTMPADAWREGGESHVKVAPQGPVRQFTGKPGQFPGEAREAMQALPYPFRVPTWIPPDLPVRVSVVGAPEANGVYTVHIVLGDRPEEAIFVSQLAPAPPAMDVPVLPGSSVTEAMVGGVKTVRVESPDTVAYHFHIGDVQISVSGPKHRAEAVQHVAESLVG